MTVRRSEVLALALRVLTVVYLAFLVLLIWNFLPFGDDIAFHLQRLDALSQEFRLGVDLSDFPFRVYTTTLDGYGYGSPLFYGDIFLYPFALLSSLGVSVYTAYRLLLIAMLLGSYLSLRLLMREVTSSTKALGFSLGLFYAVLSTTLYGEVVGSCVGRGLVWIFAPLAIAGFYRVIFTDRPCGWVLLAVGAGGTLLAHPLNIVLLLVVLFLMLAVSFRRVNRRAATQILLSATVAILATLWYTLPMLEQMLSESFFVTSAAVDNGKTILSDFTVPLSGIVLPSQLRTTLLRLWASMPHRGSIRRGSSSPSWRFSPLPCAGGRDREGGGVPSAHPLSLWQHLPYGSRLHCSRMTCSRESLEYCSSRGAFTCLRSSRLPCFWRLPMTALPRSWRGRRLRWSLRPDPQESPCRPS